MHSILHEKRLTKGIMISYSPSCLESSHDFDEVKLRNNPKHTSVTSMQH